VGLFVVVLPNRFMEAFECHGHENQCADNRGNTTDHPAERALYRHTIIDDYNIYPPSLHYDNLVRVFSDAIDAKIQPFVEP